MGRRERRARRRAEQAAAKAENRKRRGWVNEDPLICYDRKSEPIGHALRDLWKDKAGFLCGGGPSINELPYQRLAERGICSLGINNVAGYVPVKAMTFSDPPSKFHYGILYDPGVMKIVPKPKLRQKIRLKNPATGEFVSSRKRVRDMPNVWGFERNCEFRPEEFLTRDSATWGNNNKGVAATGGEKTLNTLLIGIRLMHYLGVRRVYFLGVDFGMAGTERQLGNYAFGQAGSPDGNNNAYRVLIRWLKELKPLFDEDGFSLYNCNPESHLTVFPYVPFENALEDCRAPVPVEPFDLEGWYEKSEDAKKKGSYDPDKAD
jgi:hypothetical protein